jgi:hypothetical protein
MLIAEGDEAVLIDVALVVVGCYSDRSVMRTK